MVSKFSALSSGVKRQSHQMERKRKSSTNHTFLSYSEAERNEKNKKYYHGKRLGSVNEETRVLLRVLTREVKVEISK